MTKTEFYENVIKHFCKHDIEDMYSYMGERNYECIIEDNVIDCIDTVIDDFNNFFKKIDLNYELPKADAIELIKDSLKPHYKGKMMICIHYEDIYENLLKNKIISAENEISVFRIESKNHEGFYRHFENIGSPLTDKFDFETRESPGCDGVLAIQFMNSEYREKSQKSIFGFKTKEMLGNWLTNTDGLAEEVSMAELYISEYKVKEKNALLTKNQVAFESAASRLINRQEIKLFLKGRLEQAKYKENLENNPSTLEEDKESISFLKSKNGDVVVSKKKKRKSKKDHYKNENQLKLF